MRCMVLPSGEASSSGLGGSEVAVLRLLESVVVTGVVYRGESDKMDEEPGESSSGLTTMEEKVDKLERLLDGEVLPCWEMLPMSVVVMEKPADIRDEDRQSTGLGHCTASCRYPRAVMRDGWNISWGDPVDPTGGSSMGGG